MEKAGPLGYSFDCEDFCIRAGAYHNCSFSWYTSGGADWISVRHTSKHLHRGFSPKRCACGHWSHSFSRRQRHLRAGQRLSPGRNSHSNAGRRVAGSDRQSGGPIPRLAPAQPFLRSLAATNLEQARAHLRAPATGARGAYAAPGRAGVLDAFAGASHRFASRIANAKHGTLKQPIRKSGLQLGWVELR